MPPCARPNLPAPLNPPESEIAMLARSAGLAGTRSPLTRARGPQEAARGADRPWDGARRRREEDRAAAVLCRAPGHHSRSRCPSARRGARPRGRAYLSTSAMFRISGEKRIDFGELALGARMKPYQARGRSSSIPPSAPRRTTCRRSRCREHRRRQRPCRGL